MIRQVALCTLLSSCLIAGVQAQTLFDQFQKMEMMKVTLTSDFTSFAADKQKDEYQDATFSYKDENKEVVTYDIKLKQRGKYRRRICEMPPIRLKFKKDHLEEKGLKRDYNKFKLVTFCVNDYSSNITVLKEFLAYKLYNVLTPSSFRVQLLEIKYVDTQQPKEKLKYYGFIIEDVDEVAERIGGIEVEPINIDTSLLDKRQEILAAAFQYMIGNADWSTMLLRNVKLIQPVGESKGVVVVPYDFDFSGLVNAPYALPNNDVGLNSVLERAYMGMGEDVQAMKGIKRYLDSKKDELYEVVHTFKPLSKYDRQEVIDYLNTFFDPAPTDQELHEAFKE